MVKATDMDRQRPRTFRVRTCVLLFVATLLGSGFACAAEPEAPKAAGTGTAIAVPARQTVTLAVGSRFERSAAAARLTFDLSGPADVRAFVLENPDRVVVEASAINFQMDPHLGRLKPEPSSLVKSYRFGQFAADKSRIVIDLGGPAHIVKAAIEPIADGAPSRLVIQLARCDRAAFRQNAGQPATLERTPLAPTLGEDSGDTRPVVVIDPGHGGIDPGASGLGVVEKHVVFDFASALADKLNASGQYKVVMTRSSDVFVSLGDRVKRAREAKAALFVSVHADTVAEGDAVTGATIYTASDRASDAEAARVADSENKVDQEAGVEAAPEVGDVSDILFDLTRRETRTFSHTFQRTLVGYWQKIARLNKNPQRSAGFMVLKAPDVPSVLLELGYLSSEKDVAALTSPVWRNKATDAVAASINTFFASRLPIRQTAGTQLDPGGAGPDKSAIVVLRPHL